MRITLRQVQVFVTAANEGSLTRAGDRIGLSQSAASLALVEFEKQLGTQLFDRVGKKLVLNEQGRNLLQPAEEILDRVMALEAMASGEASEAMGSLRIAASQTIGNYILPDLLGRLMQDAPGSRFDLQVENTGHVIDALLSLRIDAGFIEGFCHEPDIEVQPWGGDELLVIAGPKHPLARRKRITPELLADAAWVLREPGSGTREVFDRAIEGVFDVRKVMLTLASPEAIRRSVATGAGLGCLPRDVVQPALEAGDLVELPVPFLQLRRQFFLLTHRRRHKGAGLQRFLQFCEKHRPTV